MKLKMMCVSLVLVAAACGDSTSSNGDASCTAADAPTYETFGQAFMTDYCSSCHSASVTGTARLGAPPEDVFDTLAQIQGNTEELAHEVESKAMPFPTAKKFPTDAERALFTQWMSCGAP
jgi:uncharacterized membrane protein